MNYEIRAIKDAARLLDECKNLIFNTHIFDGYDHWMPIQAAWDSLDVSLTKWAMFWYESF